MRPLRGGGFGLLELVVALVILKVMLLGAVGLVNLALRAHARAGVLEQAAWAVGAIADSLTRASSAGEGGRAYAWGEVRWGPRRLSASDSTGTILIEVPLARWPADDRPGRGAGP